MTPEDFPTENDMYRSCCPAVFEGHYVPVASPRQLRQLMLVLETDQLVIASVHLRNDII